MGFGLEVINVYISQEVLTGKKAGTASLSYRLTFQRVLKGGVIKESSLLKCRYGSEVRRGK